MRTEKTIRKMISTMEQQAVECKNKIPACVSFANMEESIQALTTQSTATGIIAGLKLALEE